MNLLFAGTHCLSWDVVIDSWRQKPPVNHHLHRQYLQLSRGKAGQYWRKAHGQASLRTWTVDKTDGYGDLFDILQTSSEKYLVSIAFLSSTHLALLDPYIFATLPCQTFVCRPNSQELGFETVLDQNERSAFTCRARLEDDMLTVQSATGTQDVANLRYPTLR